VTVTQTLTKSEIVSSDVESLILVDEADQAIGHMEKSACHDGEGRLHRAFSALIFNPRGELLLQRRARNKRLWPAFWSNSCCSHPRAGEELMDAVHRRVEQELGLSAEFEFLYKFTYHARYQDLGSEHELCSVFLGRTSQEPIINTTEIDQWRWIDAGALERWLAQSPEVFTPWFTLEWRRLQDHFGTALQRFGVKGDPA
jgi:isopentenyl-diphosphate delta-isomerase